MSRLVPLLACLAVLSAPPAAAAPRAEILDTKVICVQEGRYIGWPTVCRTRDGRLVAAFSGDRDQHVCPFGKSQIITSTDNGATWGAPVTVNNTPLDDRDTGIVETAQGTLVLTWFTSLAFERDEKYARHAEKVTPELRRDGLGYWTRRSADGGVTWEDAVRMQGTSPHGSIALRDGRLLSVGKVGGGEMALVAESSVDDARSWQVIGTVPIPAGEQQKHYHEPHVAELPDGALVAMFRYQPEDKEDHVMRQSESRDGGRTWTVTHSTGIWGYPPHLLPLKEGPLVVVYGRRKAPFSERACVSTDGGATWDTAHELTLCEAVNSDLGYPASVQLDNGTILTVYYQDPGPDQNTCLWATRWRLVME
ncbi:MAG: exo-alpha-sialidase [Candidatus Hydrogenedentes bacterium]|nr:exo-alpha-sialidase [Candidatus Hydrogenedentota bacterium]